VYLFAAYDFVLPMCRWMLVLMLLVLLLLEYGQCDIKKRCKLLCR